MADFDQIHDELKALDDVEVSESVLFAEHTTYRIGGPADIFVEPATEEAVGNILRTLHRHGIRPFVLGHGSNLLVADAGVRGVTMFIGPRLSGSSFDGPVATVLAGTPLLSLIREAVSRGLGGMELMAGIPGGVGGALRMNAGAFGQEIEGTIQQMRGFRFDGTPVKLDQSEVDFGYRTAPQLENVVITSAVLRFTEEEPAVLQQRLEDVIALRAKKQPLDYPSCGSVFKRPPGYYAGALIEEVGMKGYVHGNAQVSPKHAGFVVNLGGATARDVRELMDLVSARVFDRFGVQLRREVKLVGFLDSMD